MFDRGFVTKKLLTSVLFMDGPPPGRSDAPHPCLPWVGLVVIC